MTKYKQHTCSASNRLFIWSNQASASAGVKLDASATAYTSPNYFMEMAAEHMNAKVSPYLAFLTQARTDIPSFERLVLGAGGFTTDTSTTYLDRNGNTVKRKNLSKQAKNTLNDYELIQNDMTAGKGYLTGTDFFKMKQTTGSHSTNVHRVQHKSNTE